MISELKTAFIEGESRTERTSTDPDVGKIDPFRPDPYLAGNEQQNPVPMDQVFGVLGNQRRRYVLKYLNMTDGSVSLSDLAERITAWECGKDVAAITSKERKRVYVSIYQGHLPKMADIGAISYDKQGGEIEKGEQFAHFTHYLRHDE